MTNKELIAYETNRLEVIRLYFIQLNKKGGYEELENAIKELGEIEYELQTKIHD